MESVFLFLAVQPTFRATSCVGLLAKFIPLNKYNKILLTWQIFTCAHMAGAARVSCCPFVLFFKFYVKFYNYFEHVILIIKGSIACITCARPGRENKKHLAK